MEKNSSLFKYKRKSHSDAEENAIYLMRIAIRMLVIFLILALFITIVMELWVIFTVEIPSMDLRHTVDSILFALILVELFTILRKYLEKGYIKVERVIEVGIISIIREIIFRLFEMPVESIYAISILLLTLGALFFVEKFYSKERNI